MIYLTQVRVNSTAPILSVDVTTVCAHDAAQIPYTQLARGTPPHSIFPPSAFAIRRLGLEALPPHTQNIFI